MNKYRFIKKTGRNKALKTCRLEFRLAEPDYCYLQHEVEIREVTISNFIKNCVKQYKDFEKSYGDSAEGIVNAQSNILKTCRVELRLTDLQYSHMQKEAESRGMTVSVFIRTCLRYHKIFGKRYKSFSEYKNLF